MSASTTTVGEQEIRYTRRGALAEGAAPVVVLHGWGAHLEAVEPIVAMLAASTEVLALDMPGFGKSAPPADVWGVEEYGRFVLRFLEEQGVERFSLVGHSFGGKVSIWITAEHPERVERLLLCDASGLKPRRKPDYYRRVAMAKAGRAAAFAGGKAGRELQERMRQKVASTDYLQASEAMRGTFRAVIAQHMTEYLPRIATPTLVVWGARDEDTPLWMGERMHELIPDSGLVVFDEAGHYAYADEPGRFAAVAREFLVEQPQRVRDSRQVTA